MGGMTDLFRFLQAVVLVYLVLVALRIIMTWFRGADHNAPAEILARVTDPYLRWFQRLQFLRIGVLDFSPAAAILVLIVAGNVLQRLAAAQRVTVGIVLAQLLLVTWSAASVLVVVFMIMAVARAFLAAMRWEQGGGLLNMLDHTLQPMVTFVSRRVSLGERLRERGQAVQKVVYLGLIAVMLLVVLIGGNVVVRWLVAQFLSSPF
jgi:YggT family protein